MKKDLTELVFILDRSGSMSGLESDTVGGFNGLLEKQKNAEGSALITTVLFDDRYEILHDRTDIKGVLPMTQKDYFVRGCTALLDAVGKTVLKIENAQTLTAPDERPEKTLVVITTDGLENASREFTKEKVKSHINRLKEQGWEFIFLGANIDAVSEAGDIGIDPESAVLYHADSKGTSVNFCGVSDAMLSLRTTGKIGRKWRANIDADYEKRKK